TLTSVTDEIRRALDVRAVVLPMSDDRAPTLLETRDGRILEFQQYFVKEKTEPEIAAVRLPQDAKPAPGVLDAILNADIVVLCPSNPFVSIAPILALPGVRAALRAHERVIAVSPIIGGRALKGPADRLLRSLIGDSSAAAVASLYADFCDTLIVDDSDRDDIARIEKTGVKGRALATIMNSHQDAARLAHELLS
ncbi:MAG TPA: 2-phospho-L-lactate transferase CofD family protein, partial [Actinomycetota bacterium]|nr:2-phospho-L-lactate transferase CofD family protein [Actinomycetota bacterium]